MKHIWQNNLLTEVDSMPKENYKKNILVLRVSKVFIY